MGRENKRQRILVIGGSGFIGANLAKTLINRGYSSVGVIDIKPPSSQGVFYYRMDIGDLEGVKKILKQYDCVVDLAAVVGVDKRQDHPEMVKQINYEDTKGLIDACVDAGIKKFLFSSSSEVYGNSLAVPYKEADAPQPISLYAKYKVEIEKYLRGKSGHGMKIMIARFFNVYGPGQRNDFVVSKFMSAALRGESLVIFGDGSQTRCFTYVTDAAEGLMKMIEYQNSDYEIVNIGSRQEVHVRQLAQMILAIVPQPRSRIIFEGYDRKETRRADLEISRRVPSVEKAKSLLRFRARVKLAKGLSLTLDYMQKKAPLTESLRFPPVGRASINQIYPWLGFGEDIKTLLFFLVKKESLEKRGEEEKMIGDFFGSRRFLLTNSGRAALLLAFRVLKLKAGDTVLPSAVNCTAVLESINTANLNVKFVEINEDGSLNQDHLEKAITPDVRALIVTHLYGLVDDRDFP